MKRSLTIRFAMTVGFVALVFSWSYGQSTKNSSMVLGTNSRGEPLHEIEFTTHPPQTTMEADRGRNVPGTEKSPSKANSNPPKPRVLEPKLVSDPARYPELADQPLEAEPLKESRPLREALQSHVYVNGVGGVAFDQVAKPAKGLQVESIVLDYHPTRQDGSRVSATINKKEFRLKNLYDWQLVPIARYADSPYSAVVTLFGELKGPVKRVDNAYVVAYHPELRGTLVGLRMFQGDFLLLDPNVAGDLPRIDGKYRLGNGEIPPRNGEFLQNRSWIQASNTLSNIISSDSFVSYVICDAASPPEFKLLRRGRSVQLSGDPYFFFWKRGDSQIEEIKEPDDTITRYQSFKVVQQVELSNRISQSTKALSIVNPSVYGSLQTVMRYSAFFRYCKSEDPQMWKTFLNELYDIREEVYLSPTPILMPRKPTINN